MKSFRELALDSSQKDFMVGAELVTSRSNLVSPPGQKVAEEADALAAWDKIDWVSITDNAGGNPMMAPGIIGRRIIDQGTDVIIHLTCKDRNRNAMESVAWQYNTEGLNNILCLTGDYPVDGYKGIAAPVFDLDSTTLIQMLNDMNQGLQVPGRKKGSVIDLPKTDFFLGCAVSPFKNNEAELMCQYLKLELKLRNGAQFIIPQLGYDMRKSHELLIYLRQHQLDVPVFGNIYILSKGVANIFNKKMIPGCYVSDQLLADIQKAAADKDKGQSFFRELAAKQYACFKGLGYRGAYFGGFTKTKTVEKIIEIAESFSADDWKSFAKDLVYPDGEDFYLFARDEKTALANPDKESPEVLASAERVDPEEITLMYHFNRFVHATVFEPDGVFYKPMKKIYELLDKKFPTLNKLAEWQEKVFKKAMFDCQDCGDCSLFDCQYLCPGSSCKKNQRNGPCGGSRGPFCESADVPCIWYRAYHRAKKAGKLDSFLKRDLIIRDQSLKGSSSWANYFLGRDHSAPAPETIEAAAGKTAKPRGAESEKAGKSDAALDEIKDAAAPNSKGATFAAVKDTEPGTEAAAEDAVETEQQSKEKNPSAVSD